MDIYGIHQKYIYFWIIPRTQVNLTWIAIDFPNTRSWSQYDNIIFVSKTYYLARSIKDYFIYFNGIYLVTSDIFRDIQWF